MLKRKRDEPRESPSASPKASADHALSRRKKLCSQRIEAAQKPLVAALRLAAGFERQKFSRRKKTAKQTNDAKGAARLDAEYAWLKKLDLNKLAAQHLRKVICKVKSLRESEVLPGGAKIVEKGEQNPALLNVQARLFKADAVRKVVDKAIDDLKEIVRVAPTKEPPAEAKQEDRASKSKKAKLVEVPAEIASEEDSDMFAAFDARIAAPSSGEDESEDSLTDGLRPPSVEDSESDGEYDLEEASESEGEEAEALTFHNFDSEGDEDSSQSSAPDNSDAESGSGSDEASIPLPKAKRKLLELGRTAKSTFVPALSHAAYYSGSESEASDLDADLAPRKNRRGQRARQKIWEAKYGDKAEHVKKQERDKGWDAKRGAVDDTRGRRGEKGASRGRGPERTGENATPLGPPKKTKRDDTGPLHPSWLAAKAAKEKKIDAKPQGKKVVFD
ncbi:Bud-site selection protein [Lentithecium fluviatile CBS 122367]|uniref:Bud-site selection protein n=1 Tax=Lentithecium fluviatile CBS 122367 TaxID=1168545 RepID=A0A6G1ICU4_9PLEO|nr:Bud-site selection protein [Lentithecium fluviatile CBS 122367]